MPLMLFSEDFIYHGESAHSGCTFEDSACNSQFNTNGETWGVVDLTFKFDTEEQRAEKAARTLAHELGHMVNTYVECTHDLDVSNFEYLLLFFFR